MPNVCLWRELHHVRSDQVNAEGDVNAKKPRQPQTLLELWAPPPVVHLCRKPPRSAPRKEPAEIWRALARRHHIFHGNTRSMMAGQTLQACCAIYGDGCNSTTHSSQQAKPVHTKGFKNQSAQRFPNNKFQALSHEYIATTSAIS